MSCCTECFESPYLKDIINRNKIIGDCSYCGAESVNTYEPRALILFFNNILDLYVVNADKGTEIENAIDLDFKHKIFSKKVAANRRQLLRDIVFDDLQRYNDYFENKMLLRYLSEEKHLESVMSLLSNWSDFDNEIKEINRFHLQNTLDLNVLKLLLKQYEKSIAKGRIYYRGRISGKDGFNREEMFNPPPIKARAGRANPTGISYLYISDKLKTTLYETRASLYDYVAIGEFRLTENITVINLRGNDFDPVLLAENEELEEFMKYKPFIERLENELSKPIRKDDKELDYIPTQYLCEFIKSLGYDGVEYKSSLCDDGYNIAIFNPQLFACTDIQINTISKVVFNYDPVRD
jgi:hypothetical protein